MKEVQIRDPFVRSTIVGPRVGHHILACWHRDCSVITSVRVQAI